MESSLSAHAKQLLASSSSRASSPAFAPAKSREVRMRLQGLLGKKESANSPSQPQLPPLLFA